ncbi:hypothetical protein AVEN_152667-1 [Araneus ventricosus]|uniref:Uncharacterized protein n=1 Tax=Araneus ventricosus TaxID=182803 RepID=A0A4Y2DBI7_ARAVE|nr:hypothetical protein AVEN_152667-1 [Araneus ventricosus]
MKDPTNENTFFSQRNLKTLSAKSTKRKHVSPKPETLIKTETEAKHCFFRTEQPENEKRFQFQKPSLTNLIVLNRYFQLYLITDQYRLTPDEEPWSPYSDHL